MGLFVKVQNAGHFLKIKSFLSKRLIQLPILEKHPDMDEYKICHNLCAEHVDFLEQIRLEMQLHYEFKFKPELEAQHESKNKNLPATSVVSDFQAFIKNAKILEKLKADDDLGGKKAHGKAVEKTNMFSKMLKFASTRNPSKKVVVEKNEFASHVCFFEIFFLWENTYEFLI
jgi:tRNA nucleotidyltransferase/poly(A) polymerase